MPARTGRQYLTGLREQEREVWLGGERVKDVTTHPGLAGGARAIASLYDMQCDPKLRDEMTYTSPTHGRPRRPARSSSRAPGGAGSAPRDDAELGAHHLRHDGPLARLHERDASPPGPPPPTTSRASRPEFGDNMRRYYEYIRENDIVLTHSLINLQRSRNVSGHVQPARKAPRCGSMRETSAGIVVRGARVLATLGPLADEIAVYSPRLGQHTEDHSPFALSFAIPCGTPGLRFLCRDSFDLGRSHFDHPLGSRFEEMDCVVFFDDVVVPWERVFLLRRRRPAERRRRTSRIHSAHSAHQGAAKNLAKCEFVLGLALLMTETLGNAHLPHTEERIGELMLTTDADARLHARRRGGRRSSTNGA